MIVELCWGSQIAYLMQYTWIRSQISLNLWFFLFEILFR